VDIAPGQTGFIDASFVPAAPGLRTGALIVQDNAPGSPHQIPITGTGIGNGDLGISADAGAAISATVAAGQTVTYNLAVAAGSGFDGEVTLTCSNLPSGTGCSPVFTQLFVIIPCLVPLGCPPNVSSFKGPDLQAAALSVSTTGHSTGSLHAFYIGIPPLLIAFLGMASPAPRERQRRRSLLAAIGIILLTTVVSGCGFFRTPSGRYTFSVTATSGDKTTSTQLILDVK
jgi:hypothetical protein